MNNEVPEKKVDSDWKKRANMEQEEEKPPEPETAPESSEQPDAETPPEEGEVPQMPPASFLTLLMEYEFRAVIALGKAPHPATNTTEEDIPQAKYVIDTLQMLKEKTNGNLDEQEAGLLESLIYGLQMAFVEASK